MNAFIIYIQDDENDINKVKVSAEVIGEPKFSFELGESLFLAMLSHHSVSLDKRSVFTQRPTTNQLQ
jgi:hypothetical protein